MGMGRYRQAPPTPLPSCQLIWHLHHLDLAFSHPDRSLLPNYKTLHDLFAKPSMGVCLVVGPTSSPLGADRSPPHST